MIHSKETTAVFLVRAKNDWEHVGPIVHRMAPETKRVVLVSEKPLSFPAGISFASNVEFILLGKDGIRAPILHSFLGFMNRSAIFESGWFFRIRRKLKNILYDQTREFLTQKLKNESRIVVCYDYNNDPEVVRTAQWLQKRTSLAKRVTLPHSVSNWKNRWTSQTAHSPEQFRFETWPESDLYVVADSFQREDVLHGIPSDRVRVLGSARFCPQWQETLGSPRPKNSSNYTVLILLSKPQMNYNAPEVWRMIRSIRSIPNVKVVVKPHTREGVLDFIPSEFESLLSFDETRTLFGSSDLILFTATSVIVDAVFLRKPVLFLRKTTTNQIYFEPYLPQAAIDTCEELYEAVSARAAGHRSETYSEEERTRFLSIFGAGDAHTLDRYVAEILG